VNGINELMTVLVLTVACGLKLSKISQHSFLIAVLRIEPLATRFAVEFLNSCREKVIVRYD